MSVKQAIILLSGGLDSTVLAYDLIRNHNYKLFPIIFDYGQRHRKEIAYALKTCNKLGLTPKIVNLSALNSVASSALTRSDIIVPLDKSFEDPNQVDTVVPNRNLVMLSLAASYASSLNISEIFFACHSGDHAIYLDCRPEFIILLNNILSIQDMNIIIKTPYTTINKSDIIEIGKQLSVPFEDTWSCYSGLDKPCGRCGACIERQQTLITKY